MNVCNSGDNIKQYTVKEFFNYKRIKSPKVIKTTNRDLRDEHFVGLDAWQQLAGRD